MIGGGGIGLVIGHEVHQRDIVQRWTVSGLNPVATVADHPVNPVGDSAVPRVERAETHAKAAVDLVLVDAMGSG